MVDDEKTSRPLPQLSAVTVLAISAAAGLAPLNSTMIAVALPEIADEFDIATGRVSILITAYLLVMLVGQPLAGRISDLVGNRRALAIALVGMALCSVWASFAPTFAMLVTARLSQAVFASALTPSVQSLLRAMSGPNEQGRTFGILGSAMGVGSALGPVIAGVLIEVFGWQAIFLINVPIVAGALVALARVDAREVHHDLVDEDDAIDNNKIRNWIFSVCYSIQTMTSLAQFALLILVPIMLNARGWEAAPIGLTMSALTIGTIIMGPPGGRAGDARGRRWPSLIGLSAALAAMSVLLLGGATINPFALAVGLAAFGIGVGFTTPNLLSAALNSTPRNRAGTAAGIFSTSRYLGSVTSSIAVSIWVTDDASGSRPILGMATVAMVIAVVVARGLPT
ncbi:MAG: MFS transporter, partial [Ilumatobacteraceae bacterium]|nr:MFS transporter [Ilumatobacteraceae bacterium]